MAASELKSNISNANFDKNEKNLFLYFDTSHTNQTNESIFHTLLRSTKRRNVVLSAYNTHNHRY